MTVAAQAGGPPGGAVDEGLKREVGFLGLMWASEGSIIGSGWLFGALTATVAPVEVLATVQYFSTVSWASSWYAGKTNTLSGVGIVVALALLVIFAAIGRAH